MDQRDLARATHELLAILIEYGHTASGPFMNMLQTVDHLKRPMKEVHQAACALVTMKWVEFSPEEGLSQAERTAVNDGLPLPKKLWVRATKAGCDAWRDEIAVRTQTRQFREMEGAIWRSRIAFYVSIGSLFVGMLGVLLVFLRMK